MYGCNWFFSEVWKQKNCLNCWKMYHWECERLFGVHIMEPCLFYTWDAAVLWLLLPTSWDRTKQASFVATAFAWYCFCQLLPVEPSEGHKLLEKSYCTGEAVVFQWTGCDSNVTCLEFFSTLGIAYIRGLHFALGLIKHHFKQHSNIYGC